VKPEQKSAADFFSAEEKERVAEAIRIAEGNTSGEIRVHLEDSCRSEPLDRAAAVFARIGMHRTALRNGVLFYLALKERRFVILGDAGINRVVPGDFWNNIREVMTGHFTAGRFAEGLVQGIGMAGVQLKEHFPHQADDKNELPDEISYNDPG
jgi:uncharacterized membrane protein